MSLKFRAVLVLLIAGAYAFGDRVSDPTAFTARARAVYASIARRAVDVIESDAPNRGVGSRVDDFAELFKARYLPTRRS